MSARAEGDRMEPTDRSAPTTAAGLDFGLDYFTRLYADDADPWGFDTEWYERRKYALTVAALPRARYRRGVEPGCANGALTELLAARCDHLTAFDAIAPVVERARRRVAAQPTVTVQRGRFPEFWPPGPGDLVVWSEIAYYLTPSGAEVALRGLRRWLEPGGTVVAVHWTGPTNYPRAGADIGPWLDGCGFLERRTTHTDPDFELGVWERSA